MDYFRAAVPLRLRLTGNGAYHALVDIDMLELDVGDLDAPGIRLLVEDTLDVGIEFFAARQHIVEFVLPQHRTQGGLRELTGRRIEIFHLYDGALRVHNAVIHHGIHLHRHIVARDHVLTRDVHHNRTQIHLHNLLHHGDEDDETGANHSPKPTQQKKHTTHKNTQNPKNTNKQRQHQPNHKKKQQRQTQDRPTKQHTHNSTCS